MRRLKKTEIVGAVEAGIAAGQKAGRANSAVFGRDRPAGEPIVRDTSAGTEVWMDTGVVGQMGEARVDWWMVNAGGKPRLFVGGAGFDHEQVRGAGERWLQGQGLEPDGEWDAGWWWQGDPGDTASSFAYQRPGVYGGTHVAPERKALLRKAFGMPLLDIMDPANTAGVPEGRANPPTEWRPEFPMLAVEVVPTDWQLEHGYAEMVPNIGLRAKPYHFGPGGLTEKDARRMLHHYLTGEPEVPKGKGSKAILEDEEREAATRWRRQMIEKGWRFGPEGLSPSTGTWKKTEGTPFGSGIAWADGDLMVERRTGNVKNPNVRWRAIVQGRNVGTARSKESAQQVAKEYAGAPLADRRPMLADLGKLPSSAELWGGSPELLTDGRYEEVRAELKRMWDEYGEHDERRNILTASMMFASHARQAAQANQGRATPALPTRLVDPVPGPDVGIRADYPDSDSVAEQLHRNSIATAWGTGYYFTSSAEAMPEATGQEGRKLIGLDLRGKNMLRPADRTEANHLSDWLDETRDVANQGWRPDDPPKEPPEVYAPRLLADLPKSLEGKVDAAMIEAAIEGARADLAKHSAPGTDTAGVRIMRAAGFDGVDVRHVKEMDSVYTGSVLFRPVDPFDYRSVLPEGDPRRVVASQLSDTPLADWEKAVREGRANVPIMPSGWQPPWPWKKKGDEPEEGQSVLGWLKSLYGDEPSYKGAASAKGRPAPIDVWDDAHTVRIAEAAGGSNGARFAEAPDGTKWLVKAYRGDADRVATELMANAVYRKLGIRVPDAGTLSFEGRAALAYPLLDGERRPWTEPNAELAEGFMADALLANWDVVGLEMDNVLWDANGVPFRVDQGGTLEYRAMGSPKEFGPVPTEVWTMAGPRGQAFGTMALSPEIKRAGAFRIGELLDEQTIDELADAAPFRDEAMRERVRENLKARVAWMRRFAAGEVDEPRLPEGRSARAALRRWQGGLTLLPEQEVALEGFARNVRTVNAELRKFSKADPIRFVTRHLDSLLKRSKTQDELAVYLAMGPGWQNLPGRRVRESGYLTATFSFAEAARQAGPKGAVVRLQVPPGVGVLSVADVADDLPKEPAVIFERGLPYRIAALSHRGGTPVLEAAVV